VLHIVLTAPRMAGLYLADALVFFSFGAIRLRFPGANPEKLIFLTPAVKSFDRRCVSCKNARTVQFSGGVENICCSN